MTAHAAGVSNPAAPWLFLLMVLVLGSGGALAITMIIIRLARRGEPREKQLSRLAGRLDGRHRATIRTVEFGVAKADLHWVAQSRGYSMIEHQFGRYYEFVRMPYQPGRHA